MFFSPGCLTKARSLALFFLMSCAATICSATTLTYGINISAAGGTAVGAIVTDGASGPLSEADIVGWNIVISFDGSTFDLTSSLPSHVAESGNDLSATSTDLLFNFSGADGGSFGIGDTAGDGVCYTATVGCPTVSLFPGFGEGAELVVPGMHLEAFGASAAGTQVIGTVVPEPSALALLGSALLLLMVRRRALS